MDNSFRILLCFRFCLYYNSKCKQCQYNVKFCFASEKGYQAKNSASFKLKLDKNEQNGQNKALIQITLPNRNVNHADNAALEAAEEPEVNVIELAKEKGSVSRKEIEKLLGVSQSICGRLLKQMLMGGQIVQQGKGKNTRYVLQN